MTGGFGGIIVGVGVLTGDTGVASTMVDQRPLLPSLYARIRYSYVTPFSSPVMVYEVSVSLTVTTGLVSGQLAPSLRCWNSYRVIPLTAR